MDRFRYQRLSSSTEVEHPDTKIIKSIKNEVIPHSPCCTEFAPHLPQGNRHLLVVGTYEHHEVQANRSDDVENSNNADADEEGTATASSTATISSSTQGQQQSQPSATIPSDYNSGYLLLYEISRDELILLHTKKCVAGVEDVHFSPADPSLLAAALSNGAVSIFRLSYHAQPVLEHKTTRSLFPESTAVLSLAWHPNDKGLLAVSLSTGSIAILKLCFSDDPNPVITVEKKLTLHDHNGMSAWTVAFGQPGQFLGKRDNNDFTLWSGGDDSTICFSTIHANEHTGLIDLQAVTRLPSIRGLHGAGVTAILPLPVTAHKMEYNLLLTGSYDDHVRVVNSVGPRVLTQLHLGDGVWNLRLLTNLTRPNAKHMRLLVLASCLEAGAKLLEVKRISDEEWTIRVLAKFAEHQSLVYRCDGQMGEQSRRLGLHRKPLYKCVSVSFYDKRLCLWCFEDEARMKEKFKDAVKKVVVMKRTVGKWKRHRRQ